MLAGLPIFGTADAGELTTPTGALLVSTIVTAWDGLPAMRVERSGYGAGSRERSVPNVLRCLLGTAGGTHEWRSETIVQLETNIDDLQPQLYERVMERLFTAGAFDVSIVPAIGKRGRPTSVVQVLGPVGREDDLATTLFRETTTLGIRRRRVERVALERWTEVRQTSLGAIELKVARLPDGSERATPEYRDVRRLAEEHSMPLIEVMRRIQKEV